MSLFAYLDGVLVGTSSIRLNAQGQQGIISLPAAADGSGSQGGIVFDDPTGSLTVTGWQVVKVIEADCTSAPVLFWGFIGDRTYRRGPYRTGSGREIDTTLIDHNTMLSARIVTGRDANRPAESQAARIAWLLGTNAVVPMFSDLGLVDGAPKILDPANYRGMYPAEVLADLCTTREEIFFTYWDQAQQKVGLFFDNPNGTTFTCSLTISNVLSDVDDVTCFEPYVDGELVVDPVDVYTTGSMVYRAGTEYAVYAPTYAFFDAPSPILTRSFRVENDKVGLATTAHALLLRTLISDSTERETLKFSVRLPSTKVGLIQAGMRISCRFSHLPVFSSFTYTRIERLTCVPTDGDPTHYDVAVECSTHGFNLGVGSGGGSTDPFPYVPPSTVGSIVQQVSGESNLHLPNPIGVNNTLVWAAAQRGSNILGAWNYLADGYTLCPDGESNNPTAGDNVVIIYKHTDGTETQDLGSTGAISGVNGTFYEVAGLLTVDQHNENASTGFTLSSGSITAAAGFIVGVSAQGVGGAYDSIANTVTYTPGSGWTEDLDHFTTGGHPTVTTGHRFDAGTYAYTTTNNLPSGDAWIAQVVSFTVNTSVDPPTAGKPWGPILPNETPNGTIVNFTMPTGYTWSTGSLKVFVDRLDQTAAVTAEDGAAGTFTLGFAPKTGWLLEVYGTEL